MGIPMYDIHQPTVAAADDASAGADGQEPTLQELMIQKDRLEEELKALGSVLDSHYVTMSTTLTTFDGYPRADIDVPQIRTTRARIIRLRNDHKDIMTRIEKGLEAHFASNVADTPSIAPQDGQPAAPPAELVSTGNTFAKVNTVEPQSPAQQAGLRPGDKIERFGDADWLNNEKLSKVAQIVSQCEGRPIEVKILRTEGTGAFWTSRQLVLTPRRGWGGRGLLGCHLIPE